MKFDMNKAWNDATGMIGTNREVLVIIAGLFFFLPNMIITMVMPELPPGFAGTPQDMAQLQAMLGEFYGQYWWLILAIFAAILVGWLALIALLRDDQHPTVGAAMERGLKGLLPALAAALIYIIGTSVVSGVMMALAAATGSGVLAAFAGLGSVVLMIVVAIRMMLISPVIVIDGQFNPFKAMLRSWELTKGNGLRLAAFFALITITYLVLSALGGIIMAIILMIVGDAAGGFVSGAIGGIISAAVSVVYVAVIASIHRQLSGPSARNVSSNFD